MSVHYVEPNLDERLYLNNSSIYQNKTCNPGSLSGEREAVSVADTIETL